MAGYSPSPQSRKLGLRPGLRVAVDRAPGGWGLAEAPDVLFVSDGEPADVVISFVRASAELSGRVEDLARQIFPDGSLWLLWPRRAAGHISDVSENGIRDIVLPLGLVDVKVAAVDDDWSGLKIVWRVERRS